MDDICDLLDKKSNLIDRVKYIPGRVRYKIRDIYYDIKYFLQKVFIGHSDMQVIEMYSMLTHHILPIIKNYRNNNKGYPGIFTEWNDGADSGFASKEEYDKAIEDGRILGGGLKAWEAIVDKIIFAFTFILTEDSSPVNRQERQWVKEFKKEHGDIWEVKKENAHKNEYHLFKHIKNGNILHCPTENYSDEEHDKLLNEGWKYGGYKQRQTWYHSDELSTDLNEKCEEGLQLFGKWFRSFWL